VEAVDHLFRYMSLIEGEVAAERQGISTRYARGDTKTNGTNEKKVKPAGKPSETKKGTKRRRSETSGSTRKRRAVYRNDGRPPDTNAKLHQFAKKVRSR